MWFEKCFQHDINFDLYVKTDISVFLKWIFMHDTVFIITLSDFLSCCSSDSSGVSNKQSLIFMLLQGQVMVIEWDFLFFFFLLREPQEQRPSEWPFPGVEPHRTHQPWLRLAENRAREALAHLRPSPCPLSGWIHERNWQHISISWDLRSFV